MKRFNKLNTNIIANIIETFGSGEFYGRSFYEQFYINSIRYDAYMAAIDYGFCESIEYVERNNYNLNNPYQNYKITLTEDGMNYLKLLVL